MFTRFIALGDSMTEGMNDDFIKGKFRGWADRVADQMAVSNAINGDQFSYTPDKNIKFPIANRPRSKKNITPNAVNAHPNVVRPMPISV